MKRGKEGIKAEHALNNPGKPSLAPILRDVERRGTYRFALRPTGLVSMVPVICETRVYSFLFIPLFIRGRARNSRDILDAKSLDTRRRRGCGEKIVRLLVPWEPVRIPCFYGVVAWPSGRYRARWTGFYQRAVHLLQSRSSFLFLRRVRWKWTDSSNGKRRYAEMTCHRCFTGLHFFFSLFSLVIFVLLDIRCVLWRWSLFLVKYLIMYTF